MLIRVRNRTDVRSSEITPYQVYLDRRRFLAGTAAGAVAALTGIGTAAAVEGPYAVDEPRTPLDAITRYNNFYEFGTDKEDPARYAGKMEVRPWAIGIDGLCAKPRMYDIDQMIKGNRLEERVYRLRCVEAWSMVIPWVGIPVADVLNGRSRSAAPSSSPCRPCSTRRRCRANGVRSSTGPTSKGCGWTRRCTR
jgi:sulfoxide reductase catalytic subunit YedY